MVPRKILDNLDKRLHTIDIPEGLKSAIFDLHISFLFLKHQKLTNNLTSKLTRQKDGADLFLQKKRE